MLGIIVDVLAAFPSSACPAPSSSFVSLLLLLLPSIFTSGVAAEASIPVADDDAPAAVDVLAALLVLFEEDCFMRILFIPELDGGAGVGVDVTVALKGVEVFIYNIMPTI